MKNEWISIWWSSGQDIASFVCMHGLVYIVWTQPMKYNSWVSSYVLVLIKSYIHISMMQRIVDEWLWGRVMCAIHKVQGLCVLFIRCARHYQFPNPRPHVIRDHHRGLLMGALAKPDISILALKLIALKARFGFLATCSRWL